MCHNLDVLKEETVADSASVDEVKDYKQKVNRITEMLTRDRMKVAFFGRWGNSACSCICRKKINFKKPAINL